MTGITLEELKAKCDCEDDDEMSCWTWKGKLRKGRPPTVRVGDQVLQARRVAYELGIGAIAPKRVIVPGKCENPACIRPEHMAAKSIQQHIRAMARRGLFKNEARRMKIIAARRAASRLSQADIAAIRASDEERCVLAKRYDVHPTMIYKIKTNETRQDYTTNIFAGLTQGLLREPEPV